VTVLGKESGDAEAVVNELGGDPVAQAGRSGEPIADDVVVLAVYFPDAKTQWSNMAAACRGRW
jgi:hypothetical protein